MGGRRAPGGGGMGLPDGPTGGATPALAAAGATPGPEGVSGAGCSAFSPPRFAGGAGGAGGGVRGGAGVAGRGRARPPVLTGTGG